MFDDSYDDKDFNPPPLSESEELISEDEEEEEAVIEKKPIRPKKKVLDTDGSDSEAESSRHERVRRKNLRREKMVDAKLDQSGFIPDEEDIEFEEMFRAKITEQSAKFITNKATIPLEILELLKKGKRLPAHYRRYESESCNSYLYALRNVMVLWQEAIINSPDADKLNEEKLHYRNLVQFGKPDFIECSKEMINLLNKSNKSSSVKQQMLSAYVHLLDIVWDHLNAQGAAALFKPPVDDNECETKSSQEKRLLELQIEEIAEKRLEKQRLRIMHIKQDIQNKKQHKIWECEREATRKNITSVMQEIDDMSQIPHPDTAVQAFMADPYVISVENLLIGLSDSGRLPTAQELEAINNILIISLLCRNCHRREALENMSVYHWFGRLKNKPCPFLPYDNDQNVNLKRTSNESEENQLSIIKINEYRMDDSLWHLK